jgi:hypothetical protein
MYCSIGIRCREALGVILETGDRDKGVVLDIDRASTNKSRKSVEIIKCPMVSGRWREILGFEG